MNKKGFTLIESIVSIAILAVLGVGFIPVFVNGFQLLAKSYQVESQQFDARKMAETHQTSEEFTKSTVNTTFTVNGITFSPKQTTMKADGGVEFTYYE